MKLLFPVRYPKLLKPHQVGHNITNIGKDEMIVIIWANEIFNPDKPDTIAYNLSR